MPGPPSAPPPGSMAGGSAPGVSSSSAFIQHQNISAATAASANVNNNTDPSSSLAPSWIPPRMRTDANVITPTPPGFVLPPRIRTDGTAAHNLLGGDGTSAGAFQAPQHSPGAAQRAAMGALMTNGAGAPVEPLAHNRADVSATKHKGVPWTEHEHLQFLDGLDKLGKGNWRAVSRYFVPTRTPTQVASHAQKHFLRIKGVSKRRSRFAAIEQQRPAVTSSSVEAMRDATAAMVMAATAAVSAPNPTGSAELKGETPAVKGFSAAVAAAAAAAAAANNSAVTWGGMASTPAAGTTAPDVTNGAPKWDPSTPPMSPPRIVPTNDVVMAALPGGGAPSMAPEWVPRKRMLVPPPGVDGSTSNAGTATATGTATIHDIVAAIDNNNSNNNNNTAPTVGMTHPPVYPVGLAFPFAGVPGIPASFPFFPNLATSAPSAPPPSGASKPMVRKASCDAIQKQHWVAQAENRAARAASEPKPMLGNGAAKTYSSTPPMSPEP